MRERIGSIALVAGAAVVLVVLVVTLSGLWRVVLDEPAPVPTRAATSAFTVPAPLPAAEAAAPAGAAATVPDRTVGEVAADPSATPGCRSAARDLAAVGLHPPRPAQPWFALGAGKLGHLSQRYAEECGGGG